MAFTLAASVSGRSGHCRRQGKAHLGSVARGYEEHHVVKGLMEDLVDRGLDLQRRYLVIDGSKTLRAGVERIFGEQVEVQRWQIHTAAKCEGVSAGKLSKRLRPADAECLGHE
jgi:hypothetical protein